MEALKNNQLKEAQKLQADGRALLKTNLLRWKPDYENAVLKLDKAATLFKGMGRNDEAYIAYKEAGQAHIGNKCEYYAAKAFEAAAGLMRDKKQYQNAADDFERAADLYHSDGKPDRAAEVYIKAAKMLEELDGFNERTNKLYASAVDVIEEPHLQADPYRSYVNFLVKKKLYDEAIAVLKKMVKLFSDIKQGHNVHKCHLSIVVLFLEMDDWPAADDYHTLAKQKNPEYFETEEAYTAQNLLDAFENNDEKRLEEIIKTSGRLKYLEGQLIQVAKRLKIKAFSKTGASAASTTISAPKKKPNKNEDKKRAALFSGAEEEEEEEEENPVEEEEELKVATPSKATKSQPAQTTGEAPKPKSEKSLDDYLNYALGDEDNAGDKEDFPEEEEKEPEEELDAFDPNNLT